MRLVKLGAIGVLMIIIKFNTYSQSLPVGTAVLENYYRRAQLLGNTDSAVSFTVRPIFPNKKASPFYPDTSNISNKTINTYRPAVTDYWKLKSSLLPVSIQTGFNSDNPYGWNDGAMIPAKGLQELISAGALFQYGPLSIQLRPEFINAGNPQFSTFNANQFDVIFARYYDIYNNVDLPVRFGTTSYQKAFWGQSSIRLNFKSLSVGLSTENLWWGPGIQNSLLMSNTAPGFPHITLNTLRPLKTPIGSFEGQIIGGRLENSGFAPLDPDHFYFGTNLYVPKPTDWRYLAGVVFTWQPKWIPGLFLGFDKSAQSYGKSLSSVGDYLPLFSSVKTTNAPDNPINRQDQLSSIFMRWIWTKEHAEIYFEFGQYNNTQDFLQELLSPNNSRAYTFGIRKLLPFNKSRDESIMIGVEVTQLQENSITSIQNGIEWYVSQAIREGYTNLGQELGAGIGPGANSQTLDVNWVKGLKKIGLQLQRYIHNNDFYYYAFGDNGNYSQHWTDLSLALNGEWNYKNLIFNAKLQGIQSLDYQWALKQNGNDIFFINQLDKFNLHIEAGATYRF